MEVIKQFREGISNTLVATCVGEEVSFTFGLVSVGSYRHTSHTCSSLSHPIPPHPSPQPPQFGPPQGLDIGDVDLIVCFDTQTSSIRLIQRMGRTGGGCWCLSSILSHPIIIFPTFSYP